ncbi:MULTISPECIES: reverse transcriptase family protein [Lysobacter]|uniref:reverse transcriptase family protein n=1 Tax=Lysobacter TaxID=68 RepID=UPI001F47DDF1|nr:MULTISPECIES: reverse transcriptase family protein [Lysobacter]UJB18505.1 reverse transcriptase family protein [Lysobacter capsici]UJQ27770.1 reverse transcriptase family protein [Lysobacter gummosus]
MAVLKRVAKKSISSLTNLCDALSITIHELNGALALSDDQKYLRSTTPKPDGSLRIVHNPHRLLRKVQRRLNSRIFSNSAVVTWPDYVYGSIPNQIDVGGAIVEKDYIACARVHCGAKSMLKMDIKDFFNNVHEEAVRDIFLRFFKYSKEVSDALTSICTFEGGLVQGALTSSYIANLCLFDVEDSAVERLRRKKLRYTRLVDDITVTSTIANYDFSFAKDVITTTLVDKDLPVNERKTRVLYISSEPLTVHGLRVNYKEPRLPAKEVARIRSAVRNVELLASEGSYRTSHSYRHDFNRCMGRVNKLKRIGHRQHMVLIKRLLKILPLPAKRDIERAEKLLIRIKKDWLSNPDSYGYAKRFYILHERLNVLARSFPAVSAVMRKEMRGLRPVYD